MLGRLQDLLGYPENEEHLATSKTKAQKEIEEKEGGMEREGRKERVKNWFSSLRDRDLLP